MPVRISVVTPSFNQASFLEQTLRSVISQRDQIHEYLVLDGGSTDGSVEIIQKYASGIDYWTSQKDEGQSDAIDRGFRRATGEFIFWINSDDVLLPGAIRLMREALERNSNLDVVTGYHVSIDRSSRILAGHRIPADGTAQARWGVMHVCQPTCVFRKSLYEKLGGLDLSLHCVMDTDLWFRMLQAGSTWGHLPRYLAGFRKHGDAKGLSPNWSQRYDRETQELRSRFPQFQAPTLRHRAGVAVYRAGQILSGRWLRAKWDTLKWRGKNVEEVFGAWEVADPQLSETTVSP